MADDKKKQALAEKEKGNAAYKSKNFESALSHYENAMKLDPTNITFLTNRAAVFFEQKEYKSCIEECEKAVETGRELRADFALIAKALARIGNAYLKMEDYENALMYFNKSLSEHRTQDVVKRANEVEAKMKEKERLAYINPDIALEEKQKGNDFFKKGDYPSAIKHYTEAIKRNPEDAKLFSNRAACYTKLMEPNLSLRDSEECIRLDPKFIKGYLRKAGCLMTLKQFSKASAAYQKALELDPNCQEALEGYRRTRIEESNDPETIKQRAMADPEVRQILSDPAMQMILDQMTKDPDAVKEHLQNPAIAAKVQKLMEIGMVAMRH